MNEVVSKMIETQALLFLYMIVGIVVNRVGMVNDQNRKVMVRLEMDVCIPLMVLNAFNRIYTAEEIKSSLVIMILAAAFCAMTFVLGLFLFRRQPAARRHVLQYAAMFSNAGTAGLPIVSLVFGPTAVFYASMYLIPPRILQWTLGVSLFTRDLKQEDGTAGKASFVKNVLLNPVVVVVYIGVIMMITGFQFTGVFASAIKGIGDMTAPLSMILIGATLGHMNPRLFLDKSVLMVSLMRLILIPILCVAPLIVFDWGIDPLILSVCVTLLSMPVATNTAAICERYDGDYVFASACVSVSTLLSIVTVPVITWIMQEITAMM